MMSKRRTTIELGKQGNEDVEDIEDDTAESGNILTDGSGYIPLYLLEVCVDCPVLLDAYIQGPLETRL